MKEQLRRASRRMTGRKVPPTPRQMQMNRRHATMYGGESDAEKGRAGRSGAKTSKPKNVGPKTIIAEESRSRSASPDEETKASKFNFKFGKSGNR